MKLIKYIKHDVNEGIISYWRRYLYVILIVVVTCIISNKEMKIFFENYLCGWSPLEYGIHEFFGRYPYVFQPDSPDSFTLPFGWILLYLTLALCVGSYIQDDMLGFGIQMMVRSGQRYLWWWSKCIWLIIVNLVYFGIVWLVNIGFAWIARGDIHFDKNELLLQSEFGGAIAWTSSRDLMVLAILMPVLVGVSQSFLQMIGTLWVGSFPTMVFISVILVASAYYSHPVLCHGYAMITRYYSDDMHSDFRVLDVHIGIISCVIIILVCICGGYIIIRKMDLLGKG